MSINGNLALIRALYASGGLIVVYQCATWSSQYINTDTYMYMNICTHITLYPPCAPGAMRCLCHSCPFWLCLPLFPRDPHRFLFLGMCWAFPDPLIGCFCWLRFWCTVSHGFQSNMAPYWLQLGANLGPAGWFLGPNLEPSCTRLAPSWAHMGPRCDS